jgi:hypothetical protein
MTQEKAAQAQPFRDDRTIDLEDPREMPYWLKFFDVSKDELLAAVSDVGVSAEAVKQRLRQKASA